MAESAVAERLLELWETPRSLWGSLATVDHKKIGLRYLVTSLAFLVLGGIEALVLRVQLAASDLKFLDPESYDQLFTMHGVTIILVFPEAIVIFQNDFQLPRMRF